MPRIFERTVLRIKHGPVTDNGIGKTGYSDESDALYDEVDTGRMAKAEGLRWLGLLCRMQVMERCKQRTLLKPEGTDV